MALTPKQAKTISDISDMLYDFLPGKPHPYANQSISFKGVAAETGLAKYWLDGSKLPSINSLLGNTYQFEKGMFCNLMINIVNKGIIYRKKKNPVKHDEIIKLNKLILVLDFKIPELWDDGFLSCLSGDIDNTTNTNQTLNKEVDYEVLLQDLLEITKLTPQARGFAFEKFLNRLFEAFGLSPSASFRITGEQIDGSLELDNEYYLIEAKWQDKPCNNADLTVFQGKITRKSSWTRGIMVSMNGFSDDSFVAFGKGIPTNLITIDGQDLYALLYKKISLAEGLRKKIRWAAETGEIAKSFFELYI